MRVGRQHARAFGLSPFFRISLTSLAITTCLRSRARLEGLPFALASTTRSPPAPPRWRRPRCCCCRRRRRVCRPLAAANRNSNNTNCARLTLFAHTSLFVCLFATVCVCVCVRRWRREGTRCGLWAVGCVCVFVCVWTVGCGRFGLLECASKILYYTFIFNLPATRRCCVLLLLPFVVVPFGTVLSLSPSFSFSSHACSLTLLLSMPFLLYVVCACIHTNIRTYVSSCVCIGIRLRKFELFI